MDGKQVCLETQNYAEIINIRTTTSRETGVLRRIAVEYQGCTSAS